MWGTGQFASYAVFGHHRPLNAVIVAGIVLLASMSSTFREELPYIVVVHGRGPVPAHPDARVRRARDVDPAPDRRPEHDLVPLPARRDGVHPRGHARLVAADESRGVEPAGGRVGPGPRPAHRGRGDPRPVPARGRRCQGHGRDLRGRGQDRRQVVQRRRRRVQRASCPRPRRTTTTSTGARSRSTRSSSVAGTRRTRAAWTSRPATNCSQAARTCRRRDSRKVRITIRPEDFHGNELLSPGSATSVDQPATARLTGDGGWFTADEVPLGTGQYTVDSDVLELGRRHEDQRRPADRGPGGLSGRTSRTCTPPSRPTRWARRRERC